MAFEHYVYSGRQRLRCGYTTGTCSALSAGAAAHMLITGEPIERYAVLTPKGLTVELPLEEIRLWEGGVSCGVRKDGGDDVDSTTGLLICAQAEWSQEPGITVKGGPGVGRVTRPGLDQPVGEAAINSVPRQMIVSAVQAQLDRAGCRRGICVTVFVPGGEEAAQRTFNPSLGIEGGISILGTTGIVEPRSLRALEESILVELKMHRAAQMSRLILTPGNYGAEFLQTQPYSGFAPTVQCSNFIGTSIDRAAALGFTQILLVGHIGKLVKVAGSIMDTHSATADCRQEIFCTHAALAGAERPVLEALMECATADACLDILRSAGLEGPVLQSLSEAVQRRLSHRAGEGVSIGAVVFSRQYGLLFRTAEADTILAEWEAAVK